MSSPSTKPTADPVHPDPLRAEAHRRLFYRLTEIRDILNGRSQKRVLGDDEIQNFVQQLSPLDVDGEEPCDFEPRFFLPAPMWEVSAEDEHFKRTNLSTWPKGCTFCSAFEPECLPWLEARRFESWLYHAHSGALRSDLLPRNDWRRGEAMCTRDTMPSTLRGNVFMHYKAGANRFRLETVHNLFVGPYLQPFMDHLSYPKPHIAGVVTDSNDAGLPGDILRSELTCAVALLRHQLRHLTFTDHRTVPVFVITLMHDKHARITQAHVDVASDKLIVRQSRLLDVRQSAEKPTEDAYILLRWLSSKPVGDTEYAPEEDKDKAEKETVLARSMPALEVVAAES